VRLSRIPSLWIEGCHEGKGTAVIILAEVFLKIAGGFLLFFAFGAGEPSRGEAYRQPTKHSENGQTFGRASAAAVFIQRGVQALVKNSFDAPVITPSLKQGLSRPDLRIGTGNQRPCFG
jgi:uncharacterized membrane protein YphA (DoxX/SURF4 family)